MRHIGEVYIYGSAKIVATRLRSWECWSSKLMKNVTCLSANDPRRTHLCSHAALLSGAPSTIGAAGHRPSDEGGAWVGVC